MKRKQVNPSLWVIMLIYVAAFGYLGYLIGQCQERFFHGNWLVSMWAAAVAVLVVFPLGMVFHETGHLVCGLLTGYRFQSFRIFRVMWKKDSDGKIRRYRYHLAGTGGQCLLEPPELRDGDMPYILYNLGGVLFNCLLAALGLVVSLLPPQWAWTVIGGRVLFVLNLMMALENGLPLRGTMNDGANLLALHACKEARQAFYIQMKGIVLLSEGKRVRDFPAEWFHMPTNEQLKNPMLTVMGVYVCDRLLDEHRFDEAQATIESLLNKDTGIYAVHRDILRTDALFCELIGKRRSDVIDTAVKESEAFWKAMPQNPAVLRTQYVLEKTYRKNEEAAAKVLTKFEEVARTYPYAGEIAAERELLAAGESAATRTDGKEAVIQ